MTTYTHIATTHPLMLLVSFVAAIRYIAAATRAAIARRRQAAASESIGAAANAASMSAPSLHSKAVVNRLKGVHEDEFINRASRASGAHRGAAAVNASLIRQSWYK